MIPRDHVQNAIKDSYRLYTVHNPSGPGELHTAGSERPGTTQYQEFSLIALKNSANFIAKQFRGYYYRQPLLIVYCIHFWRIVRGRIVLQHMTCPAVLRQSRAGISTEGIFILRVGSEMGAGHPSNPLAEDTPSLLPGLHQECRPEVNRTMTKKPGPPKGTGLSTGWRSGRIVSDD